MLGPRVPLIYSRAEYVSDAVIHVVGILAALIAAPVMVTLTAVWTGDPIAISAMVIYALTLVGMLSCSAIYNMLEVERWRPFLMRLDKSVIYLKIAGTYTPFVILSGTATGAFLAGVWGAAAVGVALMIFGPGTTGPLSLTLYLGIGWAGAFWGGPLVADLSQTGFVLLLISGVLYSLGVVFLLWQRLPFHNTIWHVFVLVATVLCYASVLAELLQHASVA